MIKLTGTALAMVLQTAKSRGLPIRHIDVDASGAFGVTIDFNPVDWAAIELAKLSDGSSYAFTTDQFQAIQRFLVDRGQSLLLGEADA